ncbi:MAG: hypothetical protein HOP10_09945 [Chitinophagaceae bacterium]|nr:hypothetical protein [Chitinophagaceae bacterium]
MRKFFLAVGLLLSFTYMLQAQRTEIKKYVPGTVRAGDVYLLTSYGERIGNNLSRVYVIEVLETNYYYINAIANLSYRQNVNVYIDNTAFSTMMGTSNGWQFSTVANQDPVKLTKGKYTLRFESGNIMVPMVDELLVTRTSMSRNLLPEAAKSFLDKTDALKQQPVLSMAANQINDLAGKVLPNPEGEYSHAIDTAFAYSHFSWIYLSPGSHIFKTTGSTISRSLTIFNPANFTESWSNVNGGINGESYLNISTATGTYYAVMLRPVTNGQTGTTNITYNGDPLVSNVVIGGKTYSMPQVRGGDMNFFTCKITGDTRIFVSKFSSSSVRGYNDDYSTLGNWNWGLASRIKKNFTGSDSVQYTFVCAYSPYSTGICDIYMGCGNGNVPILEPQNFPLFTVDDAIRTGTTGYYNCISWSGGITSTWIWPPSSLSTYNCTSANYLQCFDNFYSNNPVRYPGAWNYTRTGATEANSVVDLWKTASAYQHASVREPGNNHPHGYDWESKPGGLWRTLHPRYALTNANWYGSVSNYYKATGTYARNSAEMNFATDADAVKAGVAIFDVAVLTKEASEKLSTLLRKNSFSTEQKFNELYAAWDATKAANSSLSDPSMYCQNKEFKAMEAFALANHYPVMLLVFDKFIKGDHFIGDLLLTLTKEKYGKLLDEVKTERLANLYDKEGRYRIHGDHDNGVLYIEKILKGLKEEIVPEPISTDVTVSVSPNPVVDRLTVLLNTAKSSKVSIVIVSAQTGMKQVVRTETVLAAGIHRFETSVKDIVGANGNMLAVQVTVDGVVKTVKVMVMR